jgi:hypothetical protein
MGKMKTLKVSEEMHTWVCYMISPEGKKNFKNQDQLIRFLKKEYEEKTKEKNSSMYNKANLKENCWKGKKEFLESLSPEEFENYVRRELLLLKKCAEENGFVILDSQKISPSQV